MRTTNSQLHRPRLSLWGPAVRPAGASSTPRRALARALAASALLMLGLAFGPRSASAAFLHSSPSGYFGPDGTEASSFSYGGAGELAVDVGNRHLYELHERAGRNEGYELYGFSLASPFQPLGGLFPEQVLSATQTGGLNGNAPEAIAVDNSGTATNGNIYYVAPYESKASELYGYSSDGNPLGGEFPEELAEPMKGCGAAVDSEGHIWVADLRTKSLKEFASSGLPMDREVKLTGLESDMCTFTFNLANNDLYIFGRNGPFQGTANVWKYTAASNYTEVTEIDPGNITSLSVSLAFDSKQQILYVMQGQFGSNPGEIAAYNPDGVKLEEFAVSAGIRYITEDEQTGTVYGIAQNFENYPNSWIYAYPPTATVPDVMAEGVEGDTVHGTVKPAGGGNVTSCQFEYGTNASYGSSIPCEPPTEYTGDTPVSATLPELTPEVRYFYRVKAGNASGYNVSAGRTFVPHHVENLKTEPAESVAKTGATLEASYTGTGSDTKLHFEWGTTKAYGNETTEIDDGSQSGPRTVGAPISNLEPGTTYHYRVVATNGEGTSIGEDGDFTTRTAVTGLQASLTDLKGNAATLNATWEGDGTDTHYYFEWGGWTSAVNTYARVTPDEDAGAGTGPQHFAVPLTELQPRSYYHFRLVATNASGTTTTEQQIFRTPELAAVSYKPVLKLTTSSAELTGTVSPRSTGPTTYHFDYGLDGSYGSSTPESGPVGSDNATYPAVEEITGLHPGTTYHYRLVATSSTGEAIGPDRTFTTVPNPPTITRVWSERGPGMATLSAEVEPGFGSTVVYFQYGEGMSYTTNTIAAAPLPADDAGHTVSIVVSGLAPSTTYHFRAVAANFATATYGPDETFTTPGLPAAAIGAAGNITQTSAVVSGMVDPSLIATTYRFEFGPTTGYGASTAANAAPGVDSANHPVTAELVGLSPGTAYHFRLVATNALGSAVSPDGTFTTVAASPREPNKPPRKRCRKGRVRRHGHCVKSRPKHRHHRKHHRRRSR